MTETIRLGRGDLGSLDLAVEREWLVANALGGYASGTVADLNTRRYHGLLMAALAPPLGRTLLVAKVDVTVRYAGADYPLFSNEFADGTVTPRGCLHLESFHLENGTPVWRYALADALIEKRVLMRHGHNTTYLHFRVLRAGGPLEFQMRPLCAYRDYHAHGHGGGNFGMHEVADGFEIAAFDGARPYRVTCPGARFTPEPGWYWRFKHRAETERGLDDTEDLFCPGFFELSIKPGGGATLTASTEDGKQENFATAARKHGRQCDAILAALPAGAPDWIAQLALAADQFIVERHRDGRPAGKTVIAGYPWFGDWGRDTMIALPGLTLALSRFELAADILRTFAAHLSEGMLPNRFPDGGQPPEYNTVDATLWYFHAIDQYTRRSGDAALAMELYPALADIVDWHQRGTRYGIKADVQDGLLAAGTPGMQLTWMDARIGDWVVTPRIGKPVEVNALWHNALCVMADLSQRLGKKKEAARYRDASARARAGFARFWNADAGCLYDVIDGPAGDPGADGGNRDGSLRPNQIFAVSLPHSPLGKQQQKSVVDACARALLTSHGLRTLAPGYAPRYLGDPRQRDAAYHQGTVWAWLLGPFADAHYRVYGDSAAARSFLEPIGLHLAHGCTGSVSEIFDAEPPFTPRGCFAQAWSVAEVLRAWLDLRAARPSE